MNNEINKNDARLERYLSTLEATLRPFSVSDRAEIVTEIKSHVLSALERDPQGNIQEILTALGEPEIVANRYLIERGLKPTKPPISPIVKWLVIGFLGTVALLLIFSGFVITRFSPILEIDEQKDHVSLLGGMVEVNGEEGSVRIGNHFETGFDQHSRHHFEGSMQIKDQKHIKVYFSNGRVTASNTPSNKNDKMTWDCSSKGKKSNSSPAPQEKQNEVLLDLSVYTWVRCEVRIPKGQQVSIQGKNGKIDFDEPQYSVNAQLTNGKIDFEPHGQSQYRYLVSVSNGSMDDFVSSGDPQAYAIQLQLNNGKISHP